MTTEPDLSQFCIYTMRRQDDLKQTYEQQNGCGAFIENRKWSEGRRLFLEAQTPELRMPIIFSAADVASGLIYYAILKDVEINDENQDKPTTTYTFTNLTPTESHPLFSSLTLKSTNKPMS